MPAPRLFAGIGGNARFQSCFGNFLTAAPLHHVSAPTGCSSARPGWASVQQRHTHSNIQNSAQCVAPARKRAHNIPAESHSQLRLPTKLTHHHRHHTHATFVIQKCILGCS